MTRLIQIMTMAGLLLAVAPTASAEFVPGVTDFPRTDASSEQYVPGVTDFPRAAAVSNEHYVAGVSDFPYVATPISGRESGAPAETGPVTTDGIPWLEVLVSAGAAAILTTLLMGSALAFRRRSTANA